MKGELPPILPGYKTPHRNKDRERTNIFDKNSLSLDLEFTEAENSPKSLRKIKKYSQQNA